MTMSVGNDRERQMIAEQAVEWFVANREPLDVAQRAAFGEWLRRSPRHQEEYLELLRVWRRVQSALGEPPSLEALIEDVRSEEATLVSPIATRRRALPATLARRPWTYAAAAAGVACVGLLLLWGSVIRHAPQSALGLSEYYVTGHGQQLVQPLADGSLLHLDTDSAVAVRYAPRLRGVEVERGQVVFDVAHDPARPFRVTAGSAQVVAVGTQFDVYLQGEVTLVTVIEGRVAVGPSGTAGTAAGGIGGTRQVGAGQQVRVIRGELPAQPAQVDTRQVIAWLHRQIAFQHEALSTVAAEFSRYSPAPIVIESPELRPLAVSGVFNVDDTESFVAFLRSLEGVGVEVSPTQIRVFKL
jgi:transmembrane sensor